MNKKSQKTRKQEQVIFRCTKAEKEQPDLVETWNQINELCHLVEASGDKLLLDKVKSCLNKGGHQANVNK